MSAKESTVLFEVSSFDLTADETDLDTPSPATASGLTVSPKTGPASPAGLKTVYDAIVDVSKLQLMRDS